MVANGNASIVMPSASSPKVSSRQQFRVNLLTMDDANQILLDGALAAIRKEQENDSIGRMPYGLVSKWVRVLQEKGVPVTRHLITKQLKKTGAPISEVTVVSTDETDVSPISMRHPIEQNSKVAGGRPKGSSNDAKQQLQAKKKQAMDEITSEYAKKQQKCTRSQLPKGTLQKLIMETKKKYGLSPEVSIPAKTIRSCLHSTSKSLTPKHRGTVSPLDDLDKVLVPIIEQMANIRQPMRRCEIIELANGLLSGTELQCKLVQWKTKHAPQHSSGKTDEQLGTIGSGYFDGFMKRYSHLSDSKKGRRFGCDRSEWSSPEYLKQMYTHIYSLWVKAGVAHKVIPSVFYTKEGKVVSAHHPDVYGEPSEIHVTNPSFILFGDETGINTCMKEDGNRGGARYVVPRGSTPRLLASTSDHRATVLPITAASGQPVVCCIIFQSENNQDDVTGLWKTRADITKDPILDANGNVDADNISNYGPGKYFPSGPVCDFEGKKVPCLTFNSPKGSITAGILVKILEYMDAIELFDRAGTGAEPFLVLDGHDSRLHPSFLEYINDPNHKWNVALGVPYLTHLWQVGDADELNGCFKIFSLKQKTVFCSSSPVEGCHSGLMQLTLSPL